MKFEIIIPTYRRTEKLLRLMESVFNTVQDLISKWGGNKGAAPLIGRKFMERFPDRQCYCPLYKAWCGDDELGRFAQKVGRFYYLGNPPLIRHYTNEHTDETNAKNSELRQADLKLREERKAKGLLWGEI